MLLKKRVLNLKDKKSKLKKIRDFDSIYINSIAVFSSGDFIIVSNDYSIRIYNSNYTIIYHLLNAHSHCIKDVVIKSENSFITCSFQIIKIWNYNKNNNNDKIITLIEEIQNAHFACIEKIFYSKETIFSCGNDKRVKLWNETKKNKYQCTCIIQHKENINSILQFEDKNILISSGDYGTFFWNSINYSKICYFKDAPCFYNHSLKRFDDDRIIVGGDNKIVIISIQKRKIIKEIENEWENFGILPLRKFNVFLTCGFRNIVIFKIDNCEILQVEENAHNDIITNLEELKSEIIISHSEDKSVKIWKYIN